MSRHYPGFRRIVFAAALCAAPATGAAQADWATVDRAIGRAGTPQPGDVEKYSFPRGDLNE